MLLSYSQRRRLASSTPFLLILFFLIILLSWTREDTWLPVSRIPNGSSGGGWRGNGGDHGGDRSSSDGEPGELTIPEIEDAAQNRTRSQDSEFCRSRYGTERLAAIRDRGPINYCGEGSSAELSCFHGHNNDIDGRIGTDRVDTMCLAKGAVLDMKTGRFEMNCHLRGPDANETAKGMIPFERFHAFWYETGPKAIFTRFIRFDTSSSAIPPPPSSTAADDAAPKYTLLVKREPMINLWHNLMEIMSMMMTIDVLRISRDRASTRPLFAVPNDVPETQVLFLDNEAEGPFWDLWRTFAGRPPLRMKEFLADPNKAEEVFASGQSTLIVPLPGGSNPLWQNDWVARDCEDAPLVRAFARRVLDHYGIGPSSSSAAVAAAAENEDGKKIIRVTFVDRRGSRKVVDSGKLVEALQAHYPSGTGVEVKLVDFGALSFEEQLRVAQDTDVLVGGHGAGLTHTMFMREGRGAVVEIQPATLKHKGFRNLAVMFGHGYFGAHGAEVEPAEGPVPVPAGEKTPSWQVSDVKIEGDRFLALMDVAIKSLYNQGLRNFDAV